MVSNDVLNKYRAERKRNPLGKAGDALRAAKHVSERDKWEQTTSPGHIRAGADYVWQREVEGFTITLEWEAESIYPEPDKHGNTDYGSYIQAERADYSYEWDGEWPKPREFPIFSIRENTPSGVRLRTMQLSYKDIHYSGPGWVQGEEPGYFIPNEMDEQYAYYRRMGASRSVALDLTRQWVQEMLTMLFSSPLENGVVIVKAFKEDIELASDVTGTDIAGDDSSYLFELVEETGMIDNLVEEAKEAINKLTVA